MESDEKRSAESLAHLEDKHLSHAAGGDKPVYYYVCRACGYELAHEVRNLVCRCPVCDVPMKPKTHQYDNVR